MILRSGSRGILDNPCYWALVIAFAFAGLTQSVRAQTALAEARVASVSGTVLLSTRGQPSIAAKRGDVLSPGAQIDTRGGGHVSIEFSDGSLIVVDPGSWVWLKDFRGANTPRELFEVLLGRVRASVTHFGGKPNPYRINSPTASIAVRGTEFSVAVNEAGDTEVIVYEGLVEVASLSDPEQKVLVQPGRGVVVRPNQAIHLLAFDPSREIAGLGGNQDADQDTAGYPPEGNPRDSENAESPRNPARIYDRFVENLMVARQGPLFLRFAAYPDSFMDAFENPAYATEFSAPEGRVLLLSSLRKSNSVGASNTDLLSNPGLVDYNLSPQGSFFTPLLDHRTVIGGGLGSFRSGVQTFTMNDPVDVGGTQATSGTTTTSFLSGSFAAAHAFGEDKRTSLGFGLNYLRGSGSVLNTLMERGSAEDGTSGKIQSNSHLLQTEIKAGLTHDFSGHGKVGIYYSHGFVSADFRNLSRTLNGQPQSLDRTQTAGSSSEVAIRFRGVLTKKLFYGAEASASVLSLGDQLNLSLIVDSHEHDRTTGSSFTFGLGYAFRPRILITADCAGGSSNTMTSRTEDATGNALEHNNRNSFSLAAHEAIHADVWRHLFVSGSLMTVRQTLGTSLTLYPDRFARLLTSDGVFAPNGLTKNRLVSYYSEYATGWRFSNNVLGEYVFTTDYGLTRASHQFLLLYNFRKREN